VSRRLIEADFGFSFKTIQEPPDLVSMGNSQSLVPALLLFQTSGLNCAFPICEVREIVPMARLSAPPGLPSGLAGFLDLRGTATPIIRMDKLFDLAEQKPGLHTPMIILRGRECPMGLLVNSVRGIVPAGTEAALDLPEERTFQGCATAVLQVDGDPVHLLSAVALLEANERRILSDYSAQAQVRLRQLEETGESYFPRPGL
jgi:purine-binding chemotaxis protein CheW